MQCRRAELKTRLGSSHRVRASEGIARPHWQREKICAGCTCGGCRSRAPSDGQARANKPYETSEHSTRNWSRRGVCMRACVRRSGASSDPAPHAAYLAQARPLPLGACTFSPLCFSNSQFATPIKGSNPNQHSAKRRHRRAHPNIRHHNHPVSVPPSQLLWTTRPEGHSTHKPPVNEQGMNDTSASVKQAPLCAPRQLGLSSTAPRQLQSQLFRSRAYIIVRRPGHRQAWRLHRRPGDRPQRKHEAPPAAHALGSCRHIPIRIPASPENALLRIP